MSRYGEDVISMHLSVVRMCPCKKAKTLIRLFINAFLTNSQSLADNFFKTLFVILYFHVKIQTLIKQSKALSV